MASSSFAFDSTSLPRAGLIDKIANDPHALYILNQGNELNGRSDLLEPCPSETEPSLSWKANVHADQKHQFIRVEPDLDIAPDSAKSTFGIGNQLCPTMSHPHTGGRQEASCRPTRLGILGNGTSER